MLQRRVSSEHTAGPCVECRTEHAAPESHHAPPIVHDVLSTPGQPLDGGTRAFMERRLARDFSRVRVHSDARAAASARAVGAAAYTVGRDVVFGAGQYAPHSSAGRRLLAHELTHVVQQSRTADTGAELAVSAAYSASELEADAVASSIEVESPRRPSSSSPLGVQRDNAPIDSERSTHVRPELQLNDPTIGLAIDAVLGRHQVLGRIGLRAPDLDRLQDVDLEQLQALGFRRFLDATTLYGSLGYHNRCNQALQDALLRVRARPFVGVDRIPWDISGEVTLRIGSWRIGPGAQVDFQGRDFDRVLLTLNLVGNVDASIPSACVPTPEPPAPGPPEHEPPQIPRRPGPPDNPPTEPHTPERTTPTLPGPRTLYFVYDSTLLRPESEAPLQRLVEFLRTVPSVHVRLTGHASMEGTAEYNLRLSRSRADAIASRLTMAGVEASRLLTAALGEASPAVPEPVFERHTLTGNLEEVRSLNRRVEIEVFDPSGRYAPTFPPFELESPQLRAPRFGAHVGTP